MLCQLNLLIIQYLLTCLQLLPGLVVSMVRLRFRNIFCESKCIFWDMGPFINDVGNLEGEWSDFNRGQISLKFDN